MSEVEYYDPPKNQMQQLLEELMDRGVIREWYYSGEYHWSYTKDRQKLTEVKPITAEDLKEDKDVSHKMRDAVQSKKNWRPFKNCSEILNACGTKLIWVRRKSDNVEQLITGFGDSVVQFSADYTITLISLYQNYTFCDGSPCGCMEE